MYAQLIIMCKSVFHSTMLWIEMTQRDIVSLFHPNFFFLEILTTWKQRMRSRNHQVYLWLIYHRESVADGAERAVGPGVMFFPHFFVFNISHEIWVREVFFLLVLPGEKWQSRFQVPWGSSILAGNCRLEGDSAHLCLIKTFFQRSRWVRPMQKPFS